MQSQVLLTVLAVLNLLLNMVLVFLLVRHLLEEQRMEKKMQNLESRFRESLQKKEKTAKHLEHEKGVPGEKKEQKTAETVSQSVPEAAADPIFSEKKEVEIPNNETKKSALALAGIQISQASYYNPEEKIVKLEVVPKEEAVFFLDEDLTVRPKERLFQRYNQAVYYQRHDFARLFRIQDQSGNKAQMNGRIRCREILKPAVVRKEADQKYQLIEKGILLVEER